MTDTEVSFVACLDKWEVLYYLGGRFETAPVVAWAIHEVDGRFARAVPVTSDIAWAIGDDRTLCTPDGDVTFGLEHWASVAEWLDDMQRREAEDKPPYIGDAPIVLDTFRRKFQDEGGAS